MKRLAHACLVAATLTLGSVAQGAEPSAPPAPANVGQPRRQTGQGIAVLALGDNVSEDAFALARAIYASPLRPSSLDEVRARILAGAAPPPNASAELRDLAELRAAVTGDDAPGRRLLTSIGQQLGTEALLVVRLEAAPAALTPLVTVPVPPPSATSGTDAGADAALDDRPAPGNASTVSTVVPRPVVARLFVADGARFDAARYFPDPGPPGPSSPAAWKSTVRSLEGRFPVASAAAPGPGGAARPASPVRADGARSSPFYASAWFWGALAGAAVLGGVFYFAARDTSPDTIHLQLSVPK